MAGVGISSDEKGGMYIGSTAKIESSDVDACELDTSSDSPSCAESHDRASEKLRNGMHREGKERSVE